MREFGADADTPVLFDDVIGEPVLISDELFRSADGRYKVGKRERARSLLLLADTLKAPDEVWAVIEPLRRTPGKFLLRRRYLARWRVEGQARDGVTVFEYTPRGWLGVTAFRVDSELQDYLQQQRQGVRL